jgi:hypothetical protein
MAAARAAKAGGRMSVRVEVVIADVAVVYNADLVGQKVITRWQGGVVSHGERGL